MSAPVPQTCSLPPSAQANPTPLHLIPPGPPPFRLMPSTQTPTPQFLPVPVPGISQSHPTVTSQREPPWHLPQLKLNPDSHPGDNLPSFQSYLFFNLTEAFVWSSVSYFHHVRWVKQRFLSLLFTATPRRELVHRTEQWGLTDEGSKGNLFREGDILKEPLRKRCWQVAWDNVF